jgi:protein-disulfide isomerase
MFGLSRKKKDGKPVYLVSAAIIIAVIAISLSSIFIINAGKPVNPGNGNVSGNSSGEVVNGIALDNDPLMGSATAKVTIVEFSEFVCPFCGRFARDTFPQIKANYIDTGKVRFVFRDYIVHDSAHNASEASECAYEQGNDKYWAYNEKLFNNQGALTINDLKAYASSLGLDTAKFNACLDSGKYKAEVDKDTADGKSYGVTGTPTFFINGKKFVGAQPYAKFQAEIDAALNA